MWATIDVHILHCKRDKQTHELFENGKGALKIKITTHTTSSYAEFMIGDNVLPFLIRHITLHISLLYASNIRILQAPLWDQLQSSDSFSIT